MNGVIDCARDTNANEWTGMRQGQRRQEGKQKVYTVEK